jgi:hypothetical protein
MPRLQAPYSCTIPSSDHDEHFVGNIFVCGEITCHLLVAILCCGRFFFVMAASEGMNEMSTHTQSVGPSISGYVFG